VELGQRFFPSEVAFPIEMLSDMLINYAFEQGSSQNITPAWASTTMIQANAPPQMILDVFLGLIETRRNPCQIDQGFHFVLEEVALLLQIWIGEILGTAPVSMGIRDVQFNFSAQRVDEVISSLLLLSSGPSSQAAAPKGRSVNPDGARKTLKATQDLIRRSF
jgi:nuclear pore complex protein Nup155